MFEFIDGLVAQKKALEEKLEDVAGVVKARKKEAKKLLKVAEEIEGMRAYDVGDIPETLRELAGDVDSANENDKEMAKEVKAKIKQITKLLDSYGYEPEDEVEDDEEEPVEEE